MPDQLVVTVTAYTAFGRLQVLITAKEVGQRASGYRLVLNEALPLVETETSDLADALSQLGVACWQASERVAGAPF
jgi:hypothetical protein